MAKVFGKPSKYLQGMALIHTVAAFLYALIGLYTIYSLVQNNQAQLFNPIGLIVVLVIFGPLLLFTYSQYKKHDHGSASFLNGLAGESSVVALLKDALSDEYSIYCDVIIDPKFGNIDYVVIGPVGIFTIEVKSHKGEIGFDGQHLTKNGRQFEKDFLKQAMGQAIHLHDFLLGKLNTDIFVKPVIVFSSYAKIHFGFKNIKNVAVIQKHWLVKLLTDAQPYHFPIPRESVEQHLIGLVVQNRAHSDLENR